MPIYPLPQFETDLKAAEEDRAVYERLKPPDTIVVRFGFMKMIGEFPYDGQAKPGCGSKIVVRTHRGVEIGEMLTSTCPNTGCSKSVSRKEMLEYIENSGGRDFPFSTKGRVMRVATKEDVDAQAALEQSCHSLKMRARQAAADMGLRLKIVEAEPILGSQVLTFYYMSEDRVDHADLRRLGDALSPSVRTRVEFRQVGARDEARLTADYERCGQYCCCKNFLKVLRPVSMKSAKIQKQTLDPLKISGRCGRLMCCLRYEDQTYDELRKRLPKRNSRVGTPDGDGVVLDTQILTQLALVHVDGQDKPVAIAIEELTEPGLPRPSRPEPPDDRPRGRRRPEPRGPGAQDSPADGPRPDPSEGEPDPDGTRKKRRRRRKKKPTGDVGDRPVDDPLQASQGRDPAEGEPGSSDAPKKKRRRRRRRRPPGEQGSGEPPPAPDSP